MQINDTAIKSVERYVAAVLCDRWTDAGIQKLFDLTDNLTVFAGVLSMTRRDIRLACHDRLARLEVLHDRAEDRGFDVVPFDGVVFGDRHEILTEEYACNARNAKDSGR